MNDSIWSIDFIRHVYIIHVYSIFQKDTPLKQWHVQILVMKHLKLALNYLHVPICHFQHFRTKPIPDRKHTFFSTFKTTLLILNIFSNTFLQLFSKRLLRSQPNTPLGVTSLILVTCLGFLANQPSVLLITRW